jgi:hypothetical protein
MSEKKFTKANDEALDTWSEDIPRYFDGEMPISHIGKNVTDPAVREAVKRFRDALMELERLAGGPFGHDRG